MIHNDMILIDNDIYKIYNIKIKRSLNNNKKKYRMRKSNKIGQKSCIDISRYKYIPPSKLMKVKIHTKNNQNL
jgi:hypothetical protein